MFLSNLFNPHGVMVGLLECVTCRSWVQAQIGSNQRL